MRMCQALSDAGHEVILTGVAPGKASPEPIGYYGLRGGFKVFRIAVPRLLRRNFLGTRFLLAGVFLGWKIRKVIADAKPDIIYSRLTVTELAFVPPGVPIVYEMHSLGPFGISFLYRNLFRWLLRQKNFRRIVVTTNVLAEWLTTRIPDVELIVARLSAEPPLNPQMDHVRAFFREHFKGQEFNQHVGYTGYLDTEGLRGTDIIIQVAERMPDVAFHIVGGEPEIVEYWIQYAERFNSAGNIFFYGYRNPNEMPYFLLNFDVVLAPLQFRPNKRAPMGQNMSPLKLPQYMSYGKAIVASDLPTHREVLEDGETAVLVRHDDVDAWVAGVRQLLVDMDRREKLAKTGKQKYAAEFTPDIRVKKILAGLE